MSYSFVQSFFWQKCLESFLHGWHFTGCTLSQTASLASKCLNPIRELRITNIQQVTDWVWAKKDGFLLVGHNEGGDIYLRSWRIDGISISKIRRKRKDEWCGIKGTRLESDISGFWKLPEIHFMGCRTSGSSFIKWRTGLGDLRLPLQLYHPMAMEKHRICMDGLEWAVIKMSWCVGVHVGRNSSRIWSWISNWGDYLQQY